MISLTGLSPSLVRAVDSYRSLVHPLWTSDCRGVVDSIVPLTSGASAIRIRTNAAWRRALPGQFVTLGVEIDGVRHQRCYSLTSTSERDGAQVIEIGVRRIDGGHVSSHLTRSLRPGDLVHLDGPTGDFVLPDLVPDRLLFLTAGSGVTPIVAMLRAIGERAVRTHVTVVHHAPTREQVMFGDELVAMAASDPRIELHLRLTQDGDRRIDREALAALCPDWAEREAFVCGPAGLLDAATEWWDAAGALERLHVERFVPTMSFGAATGSSGGTVHFARSNRTASVGGSNASTSTAGTSAADPTTLLDVAEAAGIAAPSGCRNGVCHTCSTRLVSGCATDLRDGRRSDAGSHIQLCVTAADGDIALDL